MISIDPFLLFTCRGLTPSRIVAADLSCFPDASPKHKRLLDLAISSGISKGIGIPVRTLDQGLYGGWVFSTNQSLVTFNRLEKDRSRDLHLAGVLAYERMMAFGLSTDFPNRLLSDRERECLLWLCAGLRVSMIAQRLSISESAIHLYITNAKRKLGAKTREQAIARAIFSGEIEL
jgi:DNA-binding CsgD family transcriptional regulator